MGLSELSHELDIRLVTDAEQHDRQVAGDSVAPQAGLPAPVAGNEAARGAAARIGKENGPGQLTIQLGVDLGGAELAQNGPAVRPREIEDTVRHPAVLVLLDQGHHSVTGVRHARDEVDADRLRRARP